MSDGRMADSFIREEPSDNVAVKLLKKVDVFAFIPVPKDESVSTKQSLIGTALFFVIFLAFVIVDFVKFVTANPPIIQSYRTPLDSKEYVLPNFALGFMRGDFSEITEEYNDLFRYDFKALEKSQGKETPIDVEWKLVEYNQTTNQSMNFDLIPWMSDKTKQFYNVLRTPSEPIKAKGLLYVSDNNLYVRVKVFYCVNGTTQTVCKTQDQQTEYSNRGRFFLFVENKVDSSSISLEKPPENGNNYLLYNFYALPTFYKRININFQVVRNQILPDYFFRFFNEDTERLQLESVFEEVSVANYNNTKNDAMGFNFQLSPVIINNRITFRTLLDMISLWGAFWGVLFAAFALFFLSYNRRKFYKKNPEWSQFKKVNEINQTVHNEEPPYGR